MTHLLTLLGCLIGFAAIAMGMTRHQTQVLGRPLPRTTGKWLFVIGAAWLAAAWGLACWCWGAGLGSVGFSAHTMLAAGLVHRGLSVGRWRVTKG
ncbi:DUF3325 family protein [Hydrogenophaga sp.]|uniref:DUF3325 family protein n=1 Tax=Hydrogenophaga sp. TaxID=1904254 RepID=UPI002FC900B4